MQPRIAPLIAKRLGAVAQLGERVVRNDEVSGSIPLGSTNLANINYDFTAATMALLKAGMSSGLRLVMRLPSMTTS